MFKGLYIQQHGDLSLQEDGLYNALNVCVVPRQKGVYKIAQSEGYTGNFGYQWNKFVKTQIDRELSSSTQSAQRLLSVTGWDKEDLNGTTVLEVGCGAGRFTRAVLENTRCELHSVDYSIAAEACYQNNSDHAGRLYVYQASIYEMPFKDNTFDKVFCFGVLQHTPDVKKSVECLIEKAKIGGEVVVDFYPLNGWHTLFHAKYLFRPITKKIKHERLLKIIERNIDWMMAVTSFFNRLGVGKIFNRLLPICDIKGTFPKNLSKEETREWAILDTFDMLSPQYDAPQRIATVAKWFEKNNVEVTFSGFMSYGTNGKVAVVKGIKRS